MRSTKHEELSFDNCWFEVCQDTKRGNTNVKKAAYVEAMSDSFATKALFSRIALQKTVSIQQATEFDLPNVQCLLDTLIGSMITLSADGMFLQENQEHNLLNREKLWKVAISNGFFCFKASLARGPLNAIVSSAVFRLWHCTF